VHRTVLIVKPNAFHLGWMGATRRIFQITRALHTLHYDVALLSGARTKPRIQADLDARFKGRVIRTKHTGAYPRWIDICESLRRAHRVLWKIRGQDFYYYQLSTGWAQHLDVGTVVRQCQSQGIKPALVWGIVSGFLDGGLAANQIAKQLDVPWLLELHDPPYGCGINPTNTLLRSHFCRLLDTATEIVVTTQRYHKTLIEDFAVPPKRLHTIHLTFDEPGKHFHDTPSRQFVATYAGRLNGRRSCVPLLRAVCEAARREPRFATDFRLHLMGEGAGFAEVKRFAREIGVDSQITVLGYVPPEEAERRVLSSSVVIVLQSNETSQLQVPGKTFQCLRAGKPILALMPPHCETAAILQRSGLGFVHDASDVDGVVSTLIGLWRAWAHDGTLVNPDEVYIDQFSSHHLAQKIGAVLETIGCEEKSHPR